MSHRSAAGPHPTPERCDLRRTAAGRREAVTLARIPLSRPSFDLLGARYLHTSVNNFGRVSIALRRNEPFASSHPKARRGVDPRAGGAGLFSQGSGWPPAHLGHTINQAGRRGRRSSHHPDVDITESPATIRSERRTISMAPCAAADIDVAEVHDFITPALKISYEDADFAEPTAVSVVTIPEGPVADGR